MSQPLPSREEMTAYLVASRAAQGLPPGLTDGPELRRTVARLAAAAALAKTNRRKGKAA